MEAGRNFLVLPLSCAVKLFDPFNSTIEIENGRIAITRIGMLCDPSLMLGLVRAFARIRE
jgi:hypothetical protein